MLLGNYLTPIWNLAQFICICFRRDYFSSTQIKSEWVCLQENDAGGLSVM